MGIDLIEEKGYDIARKLRLIESNPGIIYITGHAENVFDAFVGRPIGFIRKSCIERDMSRYVHEILEFLEEKKQVIKIHEKNKNYILYAKDIIAFEVFDHSIVVTMINGTKQFMGSLRMYEESLQKYNMVKINRSIMLNPRYVKEIDGNEIIMVNNSKYVVSKCRLKEVKRNINAYIK